MVEALVVDAPTAYRNLIILILIMFIAPMNYIPALQPFRLALVFALIAMATYVLSVLSQGGRMTVSGAEVKIIFWLVGFAVLSITHSKWRGGSYDVLFDTYLKSIIVFFLIANLLTAEARFRGFFWALTTCAAFNALVGINNYRLGVTFAEGRISGGYSGMTSNPNDLALSLNLLIPFIWYLLLNAESQFQKIFAGVTLAISATCIVVTWSRQGAITFLSILLWYVWRASGHRRVSSLIGVGLLFVVIIAIAPAGYTQRIVSSVDFSKDKTGSADARWETTKAGLRQTFEHPFGVGLGMNGLLNHDEGMGWSAGVHNVYLQISTELGIIPVILFIVLLLKLIVGMQRVKSLSAVQESVALLAVMTECSLVGFSVAAFFAPVAYTFHFYIVAGIALAVKEMANRIVAIRTAENGVTMTSQMYPYSWPTIPSWEKKGF
jgi:O-antigen ligase